jgi:vacuolar-type H+-ATPase subunit H
MEILDLIDKLQDMTDNAKQPLLNKDQIILNENEIYDIIDQLRNTLPTAIQDAQWIKKDEERIIAAAQEEHDKIIAAAKAHADEMVQEDEITRRALAEADNIINHAEQQAHEITEGAFMYAHDIMEKLENQLTVYYEVVQEGREDIQQSLDSLNKKDQAPASGVQINEEE